MQKTFVVLVLTSFLVILALPLVSLADTSNCCLIKRSFKIGTDTFSSGWCYGEVAEKCVNRQGKMLCEEPPPPNGPPPPSTVAKNIWGVVCVLNTVYKIVDLVFTILVAIAIILVLAAAYIFMTAGGAPEKVNKARDFVLYAIVGLMVAFFARAIPSIVNLLI